MKPDQYILLIEDDQDISEAIKTILEEENIKVECTFNGIEALNFLTTNKTYPALILLDIMMPIMNGYEFREKQLKDPQISKIPTIILSASGNTETLEKLHFNDCLRKPLDLDSLLSVVSQYIS
ncbi:MAG: response regulator [Bacteriovorax sp.]|nr:response regulator [Bacteriovorax sp.]